MSDAMPFLKMNGLGNDFVVLDGREREIELSPSQIRALSARDNQTTKGCDQLIVIKPSERADVFMEIHNADGGTVDACGNATRCIAQLVMAENNSTHCTIATTAGLLLAERTDNGEVSVDMGAPRLKNAQIPVAAGIAIDPVPLEAGGLANGFAVGMGNPHIVFFVADIHAVALGVLGPEIENNTSLFPEKVNVTVAYVRSDSQIEMRTWERGAGLTQACGTGACATLVAAATQGLTGHKASIRMPGGSLSVEWREDGHVWMTGPVEKEFTGDVTL